MSDPQADLFAKLRDQVADAAEAHNLDAFGVMEVLAALTANLAVRTDISADALVHVVRAHYAVYRQAYAKERRARTQD
jgi:hypothetical protein